MNVIEILTEISPKKEWTSKHTRMYKILRSKSVLLSSLQGFRLPKDLNFLKDLKGLKVLRIEFYGKTLKDAGALAELADLEELELGAKVAGEVDFSELLKLKKVSIVDSLPTNSIFRNKAILDLDIVNFNGKDLEKLAGMVNLRRLSLYNPKELNSLRGVNKLNNLKTIEITSEHQKNKIEISSIERAGFKGILKEG